MGGSPWYLDRTQLYSTQESPRNKPRIHLLLGSCASAWTTAVPMIHHQTLMPSSAHTYQCRRKQREAHTHAVTNCQESFDRNKWCSRGSCVWCVSITQSSIIALRCSVWSDFISLACSLVLPFASASLSHWAQRCCPPFSCLHQLLSDCCCVCVCVFCASVCLYCQSAWLWLSGDSVGC